MKQEEKSNHLVTGIIIGAAAGTLITLFLQGEKGKKLIRSVKDTAAAAGEDLKDGLSRLQYTTDNLLQKGKKFINEFAHNPGEEEDVDFDEIFS